MYLSEVRLLPAFVSCQSVRQASEGTVARAEAPQMSAWNTATICCVLPQLRWASCEGIWPLPIPHVRVSLFWNLISPFPHQWTPRLLFFWQPLEQVSQTLRSLILEVTNFEESSVNIPCRYVRHALLLLLLLLLCSVLLQQCLTPF
jgi:hypothetical protein